MLTSQSTIIVTAQSETTVRLKSRLEGYYRTYIKLGFSRQHADEEAHEVDEVRGGGQADSLQAGGQFGAAEHRPDPEADAGFGYPALKAEQAIQVRQRPAPPNCHDLSTVMKCLEHAGLSAVSFHRNFLTLVSRMQRLTPILSAIFTVEICIC